MFKIEKVTDAQGVAEKVAARVPVTIAPLFGHPADEIRAAVEQFDADSIVMATHGRSGLAHLLHGSVAEAVLTRSPVPVFVVYARPGEAAAPPFDSTSARLMVPLDGSAFAEAALPVALDILGTAGELVLAHVAPPPDHVERDGTGRLRAYLDQQEEAVKREALKYLRRIEFRLMRQRPGLHFTLMFGWAILLQASPRPRLPGTSTWWSWQRTAAPEFGVPCWVVCLVQC